MGKLFWKIDKHLRPTASTSHFVGLFVDALDIMNYHYMIYSDHVDLVFLISLEITKRTVAVVEHSACIV